MTIRQGFNRLGVSVALVFLGLAFVCLCFGGSSYLQYRSEIAQELTRRAQASAGAGRSQDEVRAQIAASDAWIRFARGRYRSVEQALDLAGMCLLASLISFLFWCGMGWLFGRLEGDREQSMG